jgi:hypothetical protein
VVQDKAAPHTAVECKWNILQKYLVKYVITMQEIKLFEQNITVPRPYCQAKYL